MGKPKNYVYYHQNDYGGSGPCKAKNCGCVNPSPTYLVKSWRHWNKQFWRSIVPSDRIKAKELNYGGVNTRNYGGVK